MTTQRDDPAELRSPQLRALWQRLQMPLALLHLAIQVSMLIAALTAWLPAGSLAMVMLGVSLCAHAARIPLAYLGLILALAVLPLPGGQVFPVVLLMAGGLFVVELACRRSRRDAFANDVLRMQLSGADYQRQLLESHLRRYPVLLNACGELSKMREFGQLAQAIRRHAVELIPDYRRIRCFIDEGGQVVGAEAVGKSTGIFRAVPNREEHFVLEQQQMLIHRSGNTVDVIVPLRGGAGQAQLVSGVLHVAFAGQTLEDQLHVELIVALAHLAGGALASVKLLTEVRRLAIEDHLTGLLGREEFLRRCCERIAQERRQHRAASSDPLPIAVCVCDLDHLKRFNDRYGHAAGDAVLAAVGTAIRTISARYAALACRLGGEEFAVMVPAEPRSASQFAEDLHAAIATLEHQHGERVTVSIGWTQLNPDDSIAEAMQRADAACYQAKDAGRDQVVAWQEAQS